MFVFPETICYFEWEYVHKTSNPYLDSERFNIKGGYTTLKEGLLHDIFAGKTTLHFSYTCAC